nr:TMV resistance protein N-like [Quercus suber]
MNEDKLLRVVNLELEDVSLNENEISEENITFVRVTDEWTAFRDALAKEISAFMALKMCSASFSSIPCPAKSYEVFVSYKNRDTSACFVCHLFAALKKRGIYTFRDDTKMERGKDIWIELEKAIEMSMIAVIVFSKDYAASEWCLNELAKIMECNRSSQRIVLPIFYDVDPSEVRNLDEGTQDLNGSFGEVFARGKERFGEDKVQHWKAALNEAANLAGWYLQDVANWYVICSLA